MKVYYEEKYGGIYEVADEITENDEKLKEELMDLFNIHNECQGSTTVELIGNGDPQFQIMGGLIDAMSDYEKKFYLWHLIRFYYKPDLRKEKEKYKDDRMAVDQINRLIAIIEEIDTLLCYDLF